MQRLIVDGYNVIHAWPSLKRLLSTASLEAAREQLIRRLSVLGMISGEELTVVFDAHHSKAMSSSEEMVDGVRVIFTRKGHSADHSIERLAYQAHIVPLSDPRLDLERYLDRLEDPVAIARWREYHERRLVKLSAKPVKNGRRASS